MRDFKRTTIDGKIAVIVTLVVLFIFVPIAAYSYHFDFQKTTGEKGIRLEILTHDEFRAQFGDNPDIPLDDRAVISLARRLFIPYWAVSSESYRGEANDLEYEIGLLFAAIQNPDISDATRYEVDYIMDASVPPLPKTYTSGHFKFFYTDNDANPDHNVTLDEIKITATNLNSYWTTYKTNFTFPKYYTSGTQKMIDVKVYYLGAGYLGETDSSWNHINLNSKLTVKDDCKRKTTSAHELFHRVQYSYGYASGTANLQWIIEGTAAWSQRHTNITVRDYMFRMNSGLNVSDKALIASRSYDAAHFWVYLEMRCGWAAIKDVWKTFQTNGHDAKSAVHDVVKSKLNMSFDKYVRLWAQANYIKDLINAGLYEYSEDEVNTTSCGITYGPLSHVSRTKYKIYQTTQWSKSDSVEAYGTDYYKFPINTDVENIKITIDGSDSGDFFYSFIPVKSESYITITEANSTDYTFSKTITAGEWDNIVVVVTGRSSGGSYTISVDNPCIEGTWVDSYGYVWTLTQDNSSITGTVQTYECDIWNVTGTYAEPNITLTATNPNTQIECCTAFTYYGTVSQCSSASGTWTNECGFNGSWSMTRSGANIEPPLLTPGPGPTSSSGK
jgi:hypothetical protein